MLLISQAGERAHPLKGHAANLADLSSVPWAQVVETELTHAYYNIVSTCADPQIQMRKKNFFKGRRVMAGGRVFTN